MGMGGGKEGMDGRGKLRPGIKRWIQSFTPPAV